MRALKKQGSYYEVKKPFLLEQKLAFSGKSLSSAISKSLHIQTVPISLVLSFITAHSQGWGARLKHSGRVCNWKALDSVVQLHRMKQTKIPHLKKKIQQKHTTPSGRDGGVSSKYLEGVRGLLCSSEYLMHSVVFLTKWAPRAHKSEPSLLPCFLQESISASTDPLLAESGPRLISEIVW